ncbi:STAS domain-containing protein [Lysobacter sp. A3-1-A15]|uniref:STAS domain-containing protein n=1 Tax=Novilysobacter viscosus TaxID=3098602 RepID=UPI002EDA256B
MVRNDSALVFTGALLREGCAPVWKQALPLLEGSSRFDLRAVDRIDSAGLALLAELADRCDGVEVLGEPAGLAELRTAYRLDDALAFNG